MAKAQKKTMDEVFAALGVDREKHLGDMPPLAHRMYALQAQKKLAAGKEPAPDLDEEDDLAIVEAEVERKVDGKARKLVAVEVQDGDRIVKAHRMLPDAAEQAGKLLAAARDDLRAASQSSAGLATEYLGLSCAYRDNAYDLLCWKRAFNKYHKETSDEAALLTRLINGKAVPGFSNHTRGIAVDFITGNTKTKAKFGPNSSQHKAWQGTWFYQWLVKHAKDYGFENYKKEAWHWDYKG